MDGNNHTQDNTVYLQARKRRCTDCGKRTANYRCEACWKKRRGYGVLDVDQLSDPEYAVDKHLGKQARKQARRDARAHTPAAPAPDTWKPLSATLSLPDRQQENTMTQPMYTVPELASLLGVTPLDIRNARNFRATAAPIPGSRNHAVRMAMAEHGISWEQVAAGVARREKAVDATPARKPGMTINQDFENAVREMEAEVPTWVVAPETPTAEPEITILGADFSNAPDRTVTAIVDLTADALAEPESIDDLVEGWEPEETPKTPDLPGAFRPVAPDYARDVYLSHLPLEALVTEITRRMPRAEVVLR